MPDKSVRDMTERERAHHSLASRVFHASLMGSLLLGLVAMLVGLGLYTNALVGQYIAEAFGLSSSTALVVSQVVDTARMADAVMDIYRSLSEEERAQVGSPAYSERFSQLKAEPEYESLTNLLRRFKETSNVEDLYLAVYDRETCAIIYVCDPEQRPGLVCDPGDWEQLEKRELEKFLGWDGTGKLYDISRLPKYGWLCTAGVPLGSGDADTAAFLLADVTLNNVRHGMRAFLLEYVIALAVLITLIGGLITRRMKRTLVQPINEIAEAARSYASDRRAGTAGNNHFAALNIHTGDEVENLGLVMADMERDLSEYEEYLKRETAEKERLNVELTLANRIQADSLPNIFPPFPDRTEFDLYASMDPAKEVGGDFYDFFLVDNDHLALVIADVSGKGVPAALFMMVAKLLIQNNTLSGCTPARVMELVNAHLCSNNREEMFITAWLGILEISTGKVTAANAGHEYPILKRPGGDFEVLKDTHGMVLGGMEGLKFQEYEIQLEPGSTLFVYTDGLPEAMNTENELFGMERTLAALNAVRGEDPKTILEKVHEEAFRFTDLAPQFDDLTMLCLNYSGNADGESTRVKKIIVDAALANIDTVTDFVNTELEAMDCPMKAQMQIDVAIDELFSNIANYAYAPGTGEVVVLVEAQEEPRGAVITFIDRGMPFNPWENRDPDTSLDADEREVGGLGIFLVKKTMDDVSYEYRAGQNVLSIKKLF